MNHDELLDQATTFDAGALDIHLLEVDGRYWFTTTPGFKDGTTYECRPHLGDDIYWAIRHYESWE